MSKKKKLPKYIREQRRLQEVMKANEKEYGFHTEVSLGSETVKENWSAAGEVIRDSDLRHSLPLGEIKRDLRKNFLYLVFCVVALVGLTHIKIDFSGLFVFPK